jgi:hypothetical protein
MVQYTVCHNSVAWVREQTTPTERPPPVSEVSANFANRGCHVVRVTNPYGRILCFLDRSRYFFFQMAPQLYSWGWVDTVPDPLLLRKYASGTLTTRPQRRSYCLALSNYIDFVHRSEKPVGNYIIYINNKGMWSLQQKQSVVFESLLINSCTCRNP